MIYVDPLMEWGGSAEFRWKRSCHLYTDGDIQELIEFAKSIGMREAWLQRDGRLLHFDLNESRRKVAVAKGAQEVSLNDLAQFMKKRSELISGILAKVKETKPDLTSAVTMDVADTLAITAMKVLQEIYDSYYPKEESCSNSCST